MNRQTNVVTLAGRPYEDRSLAGWQDDIWRDMYMDLLRRAPRLACDNDLLQSGEWSGNPASWRFNLTGLSTKEIRILGRFREAAMEIYWQWDRDLDQRVSDHLRAVEEALPALPLRERFNEVANCRDVFRALADRHKPTEPMWRQMANELEMLLQDGFFQIVGAYRRLAVRQLLKGRWSAYEGRRFLEWADLEYRNGRCTLGEFGEFVVALDNAAGSR